MKRSFLVVILILLAGVIPVSIYFLEYPRSLDVNAASLPSRSLSLVEQQAQALAGLAVKPTYMMLSLLVILALIGQKRTAILALQWGQIAFLTGEVFCAVNFYIYRHESVFSEYLHSYGMTVAFAFTAYAVLEGLGMRLGSRTRSWVEVEARAWIGFILPSFAVLCFLPILTALQPESYAVTIFHFPYSYTRLDVYQLYERRILPALALTAFIGAYLSLVKKGAPLPFATKTLLCAGIGALGFSFFRVALNAMFADTLVWFEFWEETTELIFVGAVAFVLWRYKKILLERTPMLDLITKTSEAS